MRTLGWWMDNWIFEAYRVPAAGLPLFRIFFACFLLALEMPRNTPVWSLPSSFYAPPLSLAIFFPGFPPHWFFQVCDFFLVLGGFGLLFGCYTRFFSFLVAALLVVEISFEYSAGKIGHEILVPAVPFCLGFSDWGNRYSADEKRLSRGTRCRPTAWPLALLVLVISLCMLTAAISKAKSGWLDPRLECCRGQLLLNYVGLGRDRWLADTFAGVNSRLFWKFLDVSTVMLEGGFVVAMFWLPAFRLIAASACIFHGAIFYSMNILFAANPAAYASVADLRFMLRFRRARRAFRAFARVARRVRLLPLTVVVAAIYGIYLLAAPYGQVKGLAPIPSPLMAAGYIVAGVLGTVSVLLAGMDWWLWRIRFPVRRGGYFVLYDGECGLCDRWVQFVLKRDSRGSILFAPLQSGLGRELAGPSAEAITDLSSMMVWVEGRTFRESDAVAITLRQLGFPWSLLSAMALLPRFVRDGGYRFVARRRHAWFSRPDSCRVPTGTEKDRFRA